VQVDISPTEIDSNRAIAAPVVADIGSAMSAFLAVLKPGQIQPKAAWIDAIAERKQHNTERMASNLNGSPNPMNFYSALRAIRDVLADKPDIYVVNEGANTLDFGRDIIDMDQPRKRLDCGTWGVMGIGMGYAIGAAVVSGKPVVAIEGDSAFGFSGMEIETICRYELLDARYDKLIEAFDGTGHHVTDAKSLTKALTDALASGKPALINCVIDPTAGTESGHLQNLNPQRKVGNRKRA
jgi:oxalyl-CoA decarboxylase